MPREMQSQAGMAGLFTVAPSAYFAILFDALSSSQAVEIGQKAFLAKDTNGLVVLPSVCRRRQTMSD